MSDFHRFTEGDIIYHLDVRPWFTGDDKKLKKIINFTDLVSPASKSRYKWSIVI